MACNEVSDLGDMSRCRLLGEEGEWLRLLLTSPFLAPAPPAGLFDPASSDEEEDPESETN